MIEAEDLSWAEYSREMINDIESLREAELNLVDVDRILGSVFNIFDISRLSEESQVALTGATMDYAKRVNAVISDEIAAKTAEFKSKL